MVDIETLGKKIDWKKYKYYLLILVVVLILIGIFRTQLFQIGNFLFGVTLDKGINLSQEDKDFSVLILGIGGEKHEGPDLTDTIIYSNISIKDKRVDLVSIPRDLWVDSAKSKINAIYTFGKKEDRGIEEVKEAAVEVVGNSIDYVLVIDFQGFVSLIDHLGGIEVDVERSFSDSEYPIAGKEEDLCGHNEEELILLSTASSQLEAFPCRYQTINFEKGRQLMDGETALSFVRSRHGTNGEGSDFARSKRQQRVIDAVKRRVFSLEILLNPIKVIGIYNIIQDNIDTNIKSDKLDDFIKLAKELQSGTIRNFVIDSGDDFQDRPGLLVNPPINKEVNFQWVLVPRKGKNDFSEIHDFIDCIRDGSICLITKSGIATPTPISTEKIEAN